jgi:DNA-binding MarR family transcriptional regulator
MQEYEALASNLMDEMKSLHRIKPQKHLNEAFQGEAFILDYLVSQNGEAQPKQLGNEMDVSSARVATALNNLERKGLIARHMDALDRRRILIELTEKGREIAEQHHCAIHQMITKMLSLLGEDDAREYVRLQSLLVEKLPECADLIEMGR